MPEIRQTSQFLVTGDNGVRFMIWWNHAGELVMNQIGYGEVVVPVECVPLVVEALNTVREEIGVEWAKSTDPKSR